jgi:hypothetical protein
VLGRQRAWLRPLLTPAQGSEEEHFGKRLTKAPKLFFLDPGLAAYLAGLHTREAILHGPMLGALAETAVVGEWMKAFRGVGQEPPLFFWRARDLDVDRISRSNTTAVSGRWK